MTLHPGIGQPFLRQEILAVVALAPVPFLKPLQDEVLVALAHGQADTPGTSQAIETELAELAGHAPDLVPAGLCHVAVAQCVEQASLVMEDPNQSGRMGKAER
ncbi:hypothetical protein D3C78_789320 [compost metagenome]